jgi:hypothetical protein
MRTHALVRRFVLAIWATFGCVGAAKAQIHFPIHASQDDPIHGVGFMHTDVTIDASGRLTATTHTWSGNDFQGFHGSVAAVLLGQNRNLLWVSQTQSFGVDGKHVPFGGPSDRTDSWNDSVPAALLNQARFLAITQRWNPKPVALNDIANWLQGLGNGIGNELNSILHTIEVAVSVPPPGSTNPGSFGNPSTYRSTNGYSFTNSGDFQTMVGGYNWDELKDLYGCQVELSPFGWCTGVPDPLSLAYVLILNATLQTGQCFGFSLSSLRFLNGQQSLNNYPRVAGPADVWDLVGVGFTNGQNVSPNLSRLIHEQHILQTSANAIHVYITEGIGPHTHQTLMQEVTSALNSHGAVLCMQSGNNGHCIVPYAVVPQPNGDFTIENYNPNVPYAVGEDRTSALADSRITVHSASNTYQLGDGSEFKGGLNNIEVFPYSTFASPAAPTSLNGLLDIVFGSVQGMGVKTTQITDSSGHQLLNANGLWNTNPLTGIPNSAVLPIFGGKAVPGTTLLALARSGAYTQTIENHAAGKYQVDLVGRDFGVQLHNVPSNAGEKETISYSAANSHVSFTTTAPSKPFDLQVIVRHADKSVRTAHVTGNAKQNMRLEMGFDPAKDAFTFQHAGNPGQVTIRLTYAFQNASSEVTLAPVAVQHGDTLTLKPNWKDLKSVNPGTLQIKSINGGVQNRKIQ